MLSNEVFIDSATLRENIVSLARNIGYIPRSVTSARANISFFVDTSTLSTNPIALTLQSGVVCTSGRSLGQNYTFSIQDDITVPVINGVAQFNNIEIVEGVYLQESFVVNSNNPNQRFILSNVNIDTSTLTVYVRESSNSAVKRKYNLANSLFEIDNRSKVFFIQEIEDQRYELIFGDGTFGKKLDDGNVIEITYNVSSGENANGISIFSFNGRLLDDQGRLVTSSISLITSNLRSYGGKPIETVQHIRNYAPRIYAAQNRAVTSRDYEALIKRIYTEAESVSAYGGEELNPPKFGRVYIAIKPINGPFVPNTIKDNLERELRNYSVAGIVPEIVDLNYLYIEYDSTIYYNTNLARSSSEVLKQVNDNIFTYSKSAELNSYGARFKYSKFLNLIDNTNYAITSNITKVRMRRDMRCEIGKFASYEICYGNQFYSSCSEGFNIKSSGFVISGITGTVYLTDIPNDDGTTGTIVFFKLLSDDQYQIVKKNAGRVDYEKGEILLYPINIISTSKSFGDDQIIEISVPPKSNDIVGLQDLYLQLDTQKSSVSAIQDFISSGADNSGSNFVFTSSYLNGSLVRK
jgi:hypothetical protein